ncbi:adenosine deaminase [Amycolatopsis sp. NBC_00345]|uniref:adenosine deaminase n=1 Tax=Amycolatopsis sp. NBC_00345 TaxID=2975955 RepID=UPI002E27496B
MDLHVHLLGSATPATVAELARRRPGHGVPADPAEVAKFYRFTDFPHFLTVYTAVNRLVRSGEDVVTLVTGLAHDLALDTVRYAEVTVTPLSHLKQGLAPGELAEALTAGRAAARAAGVELGWVFDISGDDGTAGGESTVDWILRWQPEGTVGLGLGGPEHGVPRRLFRDAFARARAAGLHSLPHAGETTGPAEVWSALNDLGAERIGHGLGASADPRLLAHLAERGITVEVCPTSNLRTGVVGSLAVHPLPGLLSAGVPVTLGSDDPGMFATTCGGEYRLCRDRLGLSTEDLLTIARTGIAAAFCSGDIRARLAAELARFSDTPG